MDGYAGVKNDDFEIDGTTSPLIASLARTELQRRAQL
jgi:hypothetical protein